MRSFRDFFTSLPSVSHVNPYHFYIEGYTESLKLFSDVRVVMSEEWLTGVPLELQDYFYKVKFPCYFIPIFKDNNCYGFVLKGFTKMTPKFCTNAMHPGCEKIKGGELVVLVEGFKDCYIPIQVTMDLPVVVVPMLTAIAPKDFLAYLHGMNCSVLYIPDNDDYRQNHFSRFYEAAGKVSVKVSSFFVEGIKDFGDFFSPAFRHIALEQGKKLRCYIKELLNNDY